MKYKNNRLNMMQDLIDTYNATLTEIELNKKKELNWNIKYGMKKYKNISHSESEQIEKYLLTVILKESYKKKQDQKIILQHKIKMFIDSRNQYLNTLKFKNVSKLKYKPKKPKYSKYRP